MMFKTFYAAIDRNEWGALAWWLWQFSALPHRVHPSEMGCG